MNYEERVKQIAEEIASKKHPLSFKLYNKYKDQLDNGWSHDFYVKNWPLILGEYNICARIAVAKMAEAYRFAFKQAAYGYGNHLSDETISQQTGVFLQQYGLAPDKTTENRHI